MSNVLIDLDDKNPDKFLITTDRDVSIFGWKTIKKFESYNAEISPWNLSDLFCNKGKFGFDIEYTERVKPVVEILRQEIQRYKDARLYKTMSIDEIEDEWNEQSFNILFPKIQADLHQKRAVLWLLKAKRGGCFLEQGTGKTPTGIFFLGKLLYDNLVTKPLVIAPLSLLSNTVWFHDLEQFSDFKPINLRDPDDFYNNSNGNIYFINPEKYQSWCFKRTKDAEHHYIKDNYFELMKFDAIFFDESSQLKTHESYKTQGFLRTAKYAKYMGLASGSPAPNKIFQIFSQMKVLGSVLGDNYSSFEMRYGVKRKVGPTELYFPTSNAEFEIRKRIDLVSYFIKREDVMTLPKRHYVDLDVDLHLDHMKIYKQVETNYISAISGMDENGNQLEGKAIVEHEVAMRIKLLQIINGFTNLEDKNGKITRVSLPYNAKLDKLDELIQELLLDENNNMIVWCRFRWEIETIYKKYQDISTFIYGGISDKIRESNLDRWLNDNNCRIIVAIPKSAKFGHTWIKSNTTIYFSGTEDFEDYIQSRDRNYRRGQDKEVTEYRIITNKTIERKVWYCISTKKKLDKFLKDYYTGQKNIV